jgi:tRNA pseudouridine38-40 synthase
MPRYALMVEYDGAPFAGWQRQADQPSVQGALEAALAVLERDVPSVAAAGRTDAGVHATGQVAQADLKKDWDPFRLAEALNWHLKPAPVAVVACAEVPGRLACAVFGGGAALYLPRDQPARAAGGGSGRAWHLRHPLEVGADAGGRGASLGRHDFTTFRASICQAKSPVKTLDGIEIEEVPLAMGGRCGSTCRRGPSCTTRCGPSSARWSASVPGPGRPGGWPRRLRRGTALPADPSRRPRGCA